MTDPARRRLLFSLGLLLVAAAWLLPLDGLEPPPAADGTLPPPPVRGVTVLRLVLALDGLLLVAAGAARQRWPTAEGPPLLELPEPLGEDLPGGWRWLVPITLLAAVLRIHGLGSDLWLDEIATVIDCRQNSAVELVTTFHAAGRHLLNSLAVKASLALFGPAEAAIRAPAALWGIAGVPAIYLLARPAFRRREAVLAAFLLATSYHHVFFSQNARGYSGFLFWSMLGTALFLRASSRRGTGPWLLYAGAMFLGAATLLLTFFVVAGHGVIVALLALRAHRRRLPLRPAVTEAAAAWGLLGWLCLHLYAVVLPQVYVYVGHTYRSEALGFAPFSWRHLEVWLRGAAEGFGAGTLAGGVAVGVVAALGGSWFLRRQPVYTLTLTAPLVLLAGYKLAAGLRFSPRFFLWALPVAYLLLVGTASLASGWLARRLPRRAGRLAGAAPWLVAAVLASATLPAFARYYRTPKQPYRRSLEWILERRQPGEPIAGAYLAKWGLRFYGPPAGLREGVDFFAVHHPRELAEVAAEGRGELWLVTTFPRALRVEYPDLARTVEERYRVVASFDATVGDAGIDVWRRKDPPSPEAR